MGWKRPRGQDGEGLKLYMIQVKYYFSYGNTSPSDKMSLYVVSNTEVIVKAYKPLVLFYVFFVLSVILFLTFTFSHEGMTDLIALLNTLVDSKGRILIPGIYDTVANLTEEERKLYDSIDFVMVGD